MFASDREQIDALSLLGQIARRTGRLEEAADCFRRALTTNPSQLQVRFDLGKVLYDLGRFDDAERHLRILLEADPSSVPAVMLLGELCLGTGRLDDAADCYDRVVRTDPGHADACIQMGLVWNLRGDPGRAEACFRQALERNPGHVTAWNNLAYLRDMQGDTPTAIEYIQKAIALDPSAALSHLNLGVIRLARAEIADAIDHFQRAIDLQPDDREAHANLLYSLHFSPDYDAEVIYDEHDRWYNQIARPLVPKNRPARHGPAAGRRLRIGYVSPDFREHPVGHFFLPLLQSHDRKKLEIFCYSCHPHRDAQTDRCRQAADEWRDVAALSDGAVAEKIRGDGIDVLVDLAMHTAHSRILVFARKPAPLQFCYLAYCGTTGLRTIDYRITDPFLDPPDGDPMVYSEHSVRLPETYWCYSPPPGAPPVNDLPARRAGVVTFGCLNNFCKASRPAREAWLRILEAVPHSRLILHARHDRDLDPVRAAMTTRGLASERVVHAGVVPLPDYLRRYQEIDIALDPFPYGGGTTTCDALYMGVPVVSLIGETAVGRGGNSILSCLGLTELLATNVDEYVRRAVAAARDPDRVEHLRRVLRERMKSSPLMNGPRFARHVESAYRTAWDLYETGQPPRPFDVPRLPVSAR